MKKLIMLAMVLLLFGCSNEVAEQDDEIIIEDVLDETEETPVYEEETVVEVDVDIAFIHPSFDTSIPDSYENDWVDVVDYAYRNELEVKRYTVGFFQDDGDLEEEIELAILEGATHIILKKLLVIEEYDVLANYPDITFLLLDRGYAFVNEEKREYPDNVYGVYYLEHEIAFMAGVLAVAGGNEKLGIVTATSQDEIDVLTDVGFRAGAMYAASEMNLSIDFHKFDYEYDELYSAEVRNAILYEVEERNIDVVYTQLPVDLLSELEQETDINSVPHMPSTGLYTYQTNLLGAALEKLITGNVEDSRIFVGLKTDSIGYSYGEFPITNEEYIKSVIDSYKNNEFKIPKDYVELEEFITKLK